MRTRPKGLRRADHGSPRVMPEAELERYCELIAAIKVRTTNRKDHHLSTGEAIRLIRSFGMETPEELVKVPGGMLKKPTVNPLPPRQWGYDRTTLGRQPPAVRFSGGAQQASAGSSILSPSDLKELEEPPWIRADGKAPTPTLFNVVDDRSGVTMPGIRTHGVWRGRDRRAALPVQRHVAQAVSRHAPAGDSADALHGQRPGDAQQGVPAGDAVSRRRRCAAMCRPARMAGA